MKFQRVNRFVWLIQPLFGLWKETILWFSLERLKKNSLCWNTHWAVFADTLPLCYFILPYVFAVTAPCSLSVSFQPTWTILNVYWFPEPWHSRLPCLKSMCSMFNSPRLFKGMCKGCPFHSPNKFHLGGPSVVWTLDVDQSIPNMHVLLLCLAVRLNNLHWYELWPFASPLQPPGAAISKFSTMTTRERKMQAAAICREVQAQEGNIRHHFLFTYSHNSSFPSPFQLAISPSSHFPCVFSFYRLCNHTQT